ncbi:hypothetical protein [Sphingobacterium sp. JB170]|uniref:hypothetical protein n=1 Tax=Sphingobacterium sp. JB170 TaxID=1434842 RepID=UPI00097F12C1|nr:hypothetical protein [Sphingobacterium sp. JB170]SJN36290.1 hypothetical protein FM107_08800 [Sphingobacterium sp. JB170]
MKTYISNISPSALSARDLEIFQGLNREIYGEALAGAVAKKLRESPTRLREEDYYLGTGGLYHAHRDYCGIGLYFFDGRFCLGEVNDGMGPHPVLITFENEGEFVQWMANQSDQSMSMIVSDGQLSFSFNNQTITKIRLEYFLEDEYDAAWNSYCAYIRKQKI